MDFLRKTRPYKWMIIVCAIIVPGLGHVLTKKPVRGLIYVFWILSMSYITFMITTDEMPLTMRCFGGIAVWIASVIEIAETDIFY